MLLCTLLYSAECSSVAQYLYLKTRMSGSEGKSSSDVAKYSCKELYCKIKNVLFFVCFLCAYYLCEKYKPITVQYCISWVPSLILLDL